MAGDLSPRSRGARHVLGGMRKLFRSTPQDLVIAADFTEQGESAYRLVGEVRYLARSGAKISLLQARRPDKDDRIAAEVLTCLRRGLAHKARRDVRGSCRTLILHRPAIADDVADLLDHVECRRLILVCHTFEDIATVRNLDLCGRSMSVFVTNPKLADPQGQGVIEPGCWTPVVDQPAPADTLPSRRRSIAIGWLMTDTLGPSTAHGATAHDMQAAFSSDTIEHHAIGGTASTNAPLLNTLSLDRVIAGLDMFVVAPDRPLFDMPDTIIAAALGARKPVILPISLTGHYGAGPIYYEDPMFGRVLADAIESLSRGDHADVAPDPATFLQRCATGPVTRVHNRRAWRKTTGPRSDTRPVLFLPSNGVGVGHLTRLLAIARRTTRRAVFASQAPALQVIRDFGFAAEYIPSHAAVGGDFDIWDCWFSAEIDRVIDDYDPALVVYDGNHLSPGLIHAVASRRDCRLAWVRRGMWARTTSRFLANARWCDLVVEPGDLAAVRDNGATRQRRHEVRMVDPIRLLEPDELADRRTAARALNLDPDRPACLLQLGSGYNRDLLSLLDRIIHDLRQHTNLQIAVAEWVTGSVPLNLWPEVTVLRGFPISRHMRAFDFCISAAGYNSFHEMIGYGVPAIFLANRTPNMDDQYGRAKFAQDNAAAFEISESELDELPNLLAMMMQPQARDFLVEHCAMLNRPNGAKAAAEALGAVADIAGRQH